MLDRYALSPMKELWTLETQYSRWLSVELAALSALEELGLVPAGVSKAVSEKAEDRSPADPGAGAGNWP
jgi:adenylosuccinate lyase